MFIVEECHLLFIAIRIRANQFCPVTVISQLDPEQIQYTSLLLINSELNIVLDNKKQQHRI